MIYDGLSPLLHTLIVGILAYVSLVLLLRISGKRTLSKWNAFDFIVTVALGSTLANAVLSNDVSVSQAALAFALLIGLQYAVTWTSVRLEPAERVVKSTPALLVYRGRILDGALVNERVTEREVRAALRAKGVLDLAAVGALVLETDGSFSLIHDLSGEESWSLRDVTGAEPAR
jgi:uncharacterized membrane protein YcaP (DUF421 family)